MNDNEYLLIEFDNKEYYVNAKQLVKNVKDVVLEKERYVRTSVTVYENETDSKIASFIKKEINLILLVMISYLMMVMLICIRLNIMILKDMYIVNI